MFFPLAGPLFLLIFLLTNVAGRHNVTVQESDPQIRLFGKWDRVSEFNNSATHMCTDGVMRTANDGSFFEFNFTGTAIYINTLAGVGQNRGNYAIVLDEQTLPGFDSGVAETEQCRIAFSRTGLEDKLHRLVVFNIGSDSTLLLDSLTYTKSDPQDFILKQPAPYFDKSQQRDVSLRAIAPRVITDGGTWVNTDLGLLGQRITYCADFALETTIIGASLEFRFNGTAIAFNILGDSVSRGLVTVTVDGDVDTMDGRFADLSCQAGYYRGGLDNRVEHVIRITNTQPTVINQPAILSIISLRYTTSVHDPSVDDPNNQVAGLRPIPDFIPYEDLPVSPLVIGAGVTAGVLVLAFLGFIFFWARRDRLKQQVLMASADPEKQLESLTRRREMKQQREHELQSRDGDSESDTSSRRRPSSATMLDFPGARTSRDSDGAGLYGKSPRVVQFADQAPPSRGATEYPSIPHRASVMTQPDKPQSS